MSEVLTVSEVAKRKRTTRQAVYAAILSGALKATKTKVEVTGVTEAALAKWTPNPRSVKNAGRPRTRYCQGCEASLTTVDINELKACSQCGYKLKG